MPGHVWGLGWIAPMVHQFHESLGWVDWRFAREARRWWPEGQAGRGQIRRVDLDVVDAEDLMLLLGLEPGWAVAVRATRSRLGTFSSTCQLVTEAEMPRHVYQAIADLVTVDPAEAISGDGRDLGRRLDL